ncbi:polysaccharide deacetylase family protein [Candidatus Parcubacteria bacterium]|nr:polysaccharide deacetylase family protein [Candidatus Parcubacteria bacterium]
MEPKTGMVSLAFDDGYMSAYTKGLPILATYGLKATWYIIINRTGPSYMTQKEWLALETAGHEIGGHTRNHFQLDTASEARAQDEIGGGRQDLLKAGVKEVTSFAYPFGSYKASTPDIVGSAGMTTARTVENDKQNSAATNPRLLKSWSLNPNSQLADIRAAIDKAMRDTTWFIITFHRIDEDGNSISVRHELLEGVAAYLVEKKVPVYTVSQAYKRLRL